MKKFILAITLVMTSTVAFAENKLFSIDKWEGAGGDTKFYYVHFTIEQPKLEVSCRLFDSNGGVIDTDTWRFYDSGWEKVVMGTGRTTNATNIKCRAKTF